jgi:hypothetical protein
MLWKFMCLTPCAANIALHKVREALTYLELLRMRCDRQGQRFRFIMIDNPEGVVALMQKLKMHLPIPARGTGGLVRTLRDKGVKFPATRRVQIEDVFYAGDEGGTMCAIKGSGDEKTAVVVSLTHLRIAGNPIAQDIRAYQLARTQKLAWGQ